MQRYLVLGTAVAIVLFGMALGWGLDIPASTENAAGYGLTDAPRPLDIVALAQASPVYEWTWNTIDGGGTSFGSGACYVLCGTAGQPDAGVLTGGGYTLGGGFWRGGAVVGPVYKVYLPVVVRNYP